MDDQVFLLHHIGRFPLDNIDDDLFGEGVELLAIFLHLSDLLEEQFRLLLLADHFHHVPSRHDPQLREQGLD